MNSSGIGVLHEDEACLVINKPGGLLTQAPIGIDSLEFRIKRMLAERQAEQTVTPALSRGEREKGQAGEVYLGVPHRLDRPVSGVIVFAKTLKAAQKISLQFERRFVKKTYWALVEGVVSPEEGTWIDQMKKVEGQPQSVVVDAADPEGRRAVLHYRVIECVRAGNSAHGPHPVPASRDHPLPGGEGLGDRTLLEITLDTGRTHQIRVQCASRGHVLVGDEMYGSTQAFGPRFEDLRERLIGLHARTLGFRHPVTKEDLEFVAPLPEVWREAGVVESAGSKLAPGEA